MKKVLLVAILVVCVIGCVFGKSNKLIAEHQDYKIEYTEESADLIEGIVEYMDSHKTAVHEFFGIEGLKKPAKIIIYPNLEEWKSYIVSTGRKYYEWSVGNADGGVIRMLNYHEYSKLKSHKRDTFEYYCKTVFHEYVHFCHQQIKKTNGSYKFFNEGLASYLSNQDRRPIKFSEYNFDDYTDNKKFNSLKNMYGYSHYVVKRMVERLPHEQILEYAKDYRNIKKDLDKIKALLVDE